MAPRGDESDMHEILGSVGIFVKDHKFKVVTDGGALLDESPTGTDFSYRMRMNLEIGF